LGKPLLNKNKSNQLSKPHKLAEEITIEQDEEAAKEYIKGINLQHVEDKARQ